MLPFSLLLYTLFFTLYIDGSAGETRSAHLSGLQHIDYGGGHHHYLHQHSDSPSTRKPFQWNQGISSVSLNQHTENRIKYGNQSGNKNPLNTKKKGNIWWPWASYQDWLANNERRDGNNIEPKPRTLRRKRKHEKSKPRKKNHLKRQRKNKLRNNPILTINSKNTEILNFPIIDRKKLLEPSKASDVEALNSFTNKSGIVNGKNISVAEKNKNSDNRNTNFEFDKENGNVFKYGLSFVHGTYSDDQKQINNDSEISSNYGQTKIVSSLSNQSSILERNGKSNGEYGNSKVKWYLNSLENQGSDDSAALENTLKSSIIPESVVERISGQDNEIHSMYHSLPYWRDSIVQTASASYERDVNECLENNGGCQGLCINTRGSYRCHCPPGFRLDHTKTACLDINECLARNGHGPCDGECVNTWGSYRCDCRGIPGTILSHDGHTCKPVDHCADAGCSHSCIPTRAGSFCTCPLGLELSEDWKTCTDINECTGANSCAHADCVNTFGSYRCLLES